MLVNATKKRIDPSLQMILSMIGNGKNHEPTDKAGIYIGGNWNFEDSFYVNDNWDLQLQNKDGEWFGVYGVCDSVEQILEQCPMILDSEKAFCISLVEIRRDEQPADGGWRWHKWGSYIGNQNPQFEYLYDEDIEFVYTYHIYEVDIPDLTQKVTEIH